jgi:hypothetical protein
VIQSTETRFQGIGFSRYTALTDLPRDFCSAEVNKMENFFITRPNPENPLSEEFIPTRNGEQESGNNYWGLWYYLLS